jgi:hypothetical protein
MNVEDNIIMTISVKLMSYIFFGLKKNTYIIPIIRQGI